MTDWWNKLRSYKLIKIYSDLIKSKNYKKIKIFLLKHPFTSFFITLSLLLLIIIIGNLLPNKQELKKEKPSLVKEVSVYKIGETPKIRLQAKIEKKGIVKIVALAPGIVSSILVTEGQNVSKGQTLVWLSSNYQGGRAQSLQSELARLQYQNIKDTLTNQKEIIQKQREIAEKTRENTEELRKISEQSLGSTKGLLDLNQQILNSLNEQIKQLEEANAPQENIFPLKVQKAQIESGFNQLLNNLRNLEYTTNKINPPANLADLQKDITLKQLDLQEKALELNKQVSGIQYNLALINESLMYPSAPFVGVVERVHVQIGQLVNPGTPLVTISSAQISANAVVNTPRNIALLVSKIEPSLLHLGKREISIIPSYISTVATEGQMYSVIYNLPKNLLDEIPEENSIPVDIPLNIPNIGNTNPFVPIDVVYQSQTESYVNIVKNGKAQTKKITLGNVYGEYVEVISGLTKDDQIILNRNIISGDKVKIISK
jgi:multidrug efflux pump subunit AcrA (membrane-fusion protein)